MLTFCFCFKVGFTYILLFNQIHVIIFYYFFGTYTFRYTVTLYSYNCMRIINDSRKHFDACENIADVIFASTKCELLHCGIIGTKYMDISFFSSTVMIFKGTIKWIHFIFRTDLFHSRHPDWPWNWLN